LLQSFALPSVPLISTGGLLSLTGILLIGFEPPRSLPTLPRDPEKGKREEI